MARSFTNIKAISTLVADGFFNSLTRRGYAAAATQNTTRGVATSISGKMVAQKSGTDKVANKEKVSWVPDPVTGYYKPENTNVVDVADLRATVLGKK
ncbi:indole-3-acetic acid-induced protein ARG2 [Lathyrus oleraceus]|uniref:Amino-acid acetyltransferase n=1 Tax=Pisum sativum TaxID=3888 RepID=A0A9D4WE57_PEA|nr:indole-3-acetic acid-induced protein ARG2-like [Pisum sativum]KAI5399130.1 Amino-acid acetyltransferase [Pisum sativum]